MTYVFKIIINVSIDPSSVIFSFIKMVENGLEALAKFRENLLRQKRVKLSL
jgi:hypothetical protein